VHTTNTKLLLESLFIFSTNESTKKRPLANDFTSMSLNARLTTSLPAGNAAYLQPLCVCLLVRSRTVNGRWWWRWTRNLPPIFAKNLPSWYIVFQEMWLLISNHISWKLNSGELMGVSESKLPRQVRARLQESDIQYFPTLRSYYRQHCAQRKSASI